MCRRGGQATATATGGCVVQCEQTQSLRGLTTERSQRHKAAGAGVTASASSARPRVRRRSARRGGEAVGASQSSSARRRRRSTTWALF